MDTKKLIVIEGACDGIGKSTQFALLSERLAALGVRVATHHFPSYDTPAGAPVEAYLRGELGAPEELSPYLVTSLYAIDRAVTWQTSLKEKHDAGELILLDRYTTSSLIYQSAFITERAEKARFIEYVSDYEYGKLGIPSPDLVIFLDAPFEAAAALRSAREENDGVEHDIHESSDSFMRRVYDSAQTVCESAGWHRIACTDENGKMRSREDIHEEIWACVSALLGDVL